MSRRTSAPGLFGALASKPDDLDAALRRLTPAHQANVLRCSLPRKEDGDSKRGPARSFALISGPHVASGQVGVAGSVSSPLVSFVGHLTNPVEGIDDSTENPAEAVRRAYQKWGTGCFTHLNGNFAVAILDPDLPGLVLARDAGGTKPLFYCSLADNFVFGSSASEVLWASGTPTAANPHALLRYLISGGVCGEAETMFEGVNWLPGSHYLEIVPGESPRVHPIPCGINADAAAEPATFEQACEELRSLLLETVRLQSSGKRTGVAVSGGIDSSGLAACLRSALGPDEPLHAFCYVHGHPGLPEAWNELPWAQQIAQQVHATLHTVSLEASAIPGAMSRAFPTQEFPFSSPVIFAQAKVLRCAAEHGMEIMLSGHGPDFIFGGTNSHILARGSALLRRGRWLAAWSFFQDAASYAELRPGRMLLSSARQAMPAFRVRGQFPSALPWIRRSWFLERSAVRDEEPLFRSADPMRQLILNQLYRNPVPSGLNWEECNTSASGLENRLPYLVAATLRLAGRLPAEYLVSDAAQTRRIMRRALRGLVPDPILDRPHPVGFAVPLVPWLHELRPWVQDRVHELRSLPFYDGAPASTLWSRLQGSALSAGSAAYCTWRWIALLEWAKAFNIKFE